MSVNTDELIELSKQVKGDDRRQTYIVARLEGCDHLEALRVARRASADPLDINNPQRGPRGERYYEVRDENGNIKKSKYRPPLTSDFQEYDDVAHFGKVEQSNDDLVRELWCNFLLIPNLLDSLTTNQRDIVVRYFGIDCPRESQAEMARKRGVRIQTIHRAYIRAMNKLKEEVNVQGIDRESVFLR